MVASRAISILHPPPPNVLLVPSQRTLSHDYMKSSSQSSSRFWLLAASISSSLLRKSYAWSFWNLSCSLSFFKRASSFFYIVGEGGAIMRFPLPRQRLFLFFSLVISLSLSSCSVCAKGREVQRSPGRRGRGKKIRQHTLACCVAWSCLRRSRSRSSFSCFRLGCFSTLVLLSRLTMGFSRWRTSTFLT